jgi:hypothetical protein
MACRPSEIYSCEAYLRPGEPQTACVVDGAHLVAVCAQAACNRLRIFACRGRDFSFLHVPRAFLEFGFTP